MTLQLGEMAPDVSFGLGDGSDVTLAQLAAGGPVVIAFLRHFG